MTNIILTTDALDCVSGYTVSNVIVRNLPPLLPTVTAPRAGSTTYNTQPRFLITLGIESDGDRQMLSIRKADGAWEDVGGWQGNNAMLIYQHDTLPPGTVSVSFKVRDEGVGDESGVVTRSFTIRASPFEEILPNETPVKAAHINTIRTAVNHIRAYYSMTAFVWQEEVIGGKTELLRWTDHILEIRLAIEQIINRHGNVTVFDAPDWIPITAGRPRADIMAQIHAIIPQL